jgi:hypothetical protein
MAHYRQEFGREWQDVTIAAVLFSPTPRLSAMTPFEIVGSFLIIAVLIRDCYLLEIVADY